MFTSTGSPHHNNNMNESVDEYFFHNSSTLRYSSNAILCHQDIYIQDISTVITVVHMDCRLRFPPSLKATWCPEKTNIAVDWHINDFLSEC